MSNHIGQCNTLQMKPLIYTNNTSAQTIHIRIKIFRSTMVQFSDFYRYMKKLELNNNFLICFPLNQIYSVQILTARHPIKQLLCTQIQ